MSYFDFTDDIIGIDQSNGITPTAMQPLLPNQQAHLQLLINNNLKIYLIGGIFNLELHQHFLIHSGYHKHQSHHYLILGQHRIIIQFIHHLIINYHHHHLLSSILINGQIQIIIHHGKFQHFH